MTSIRPAADEDIPMVAALSRDWEQEGVTIGQRADTPAELAAKLGPWFLVACRGQNIIGFVTAAERALAPGEWVVQPDGGRCLSIEDLYVVPHHRREGLGTRLYKSVVANAATQGIRHVSVYTASQPWGDAIAFYESLGLRVWFIQLHA